MPSRSLLPPKGRKKFRDEACEASRSHIHGRGIFSKLAASFKCCREPIGMLLLWMRNDYFQNQFLSYKKLRSLFHSAKDVDKSIPKKDEPEHVDSDEEIANPSERVQNK